jgi:hypothetical protein
MIVETHNLKVMGLMTLHMLAALIIALIVDSDSVACVGVLLFLAGLSGVLHTTGLLRTEMREAHIELANAVAIVHRTYGLNLDPTQFSHELAKCVSDRLGEKTFRLITVRMNVW